MATLEIDYYSKFSRVISNPWQKDLRSKKKGMSKSLQVTVTITAIERLDIWCG